MAVNAYVGLPGIAGDSVFKAIAIAARIPYVRVMLELNRRVANYLRGKRVLRRARVRHGAYVTVAHGYLEELGWEWHPCMWPGIGCRVHLVKDELPPGRLIVQVSRELVAVVDGRVYGVRRDFGRRGFRGDVTRGGTRCVYGYWRN